MVAIGLPNNWTYDGTEMLLGQQADKAKDEELISLNPHG